MGTVVPAGRRLTRERRRGHRRALAVTGAVVALGAAVVASGTWAAWTVALNNGTNVFGTGNVQLYDTQGGKAGGTASATGTALVTVSNLTPGDAVTRCIGLDVVLTNTTASQLQITAALTGDTATLGQALRVTAAEYKDAVLNESATSAGAVDAADTDCTNYTAAGGSATSVGSPGASTQLATWAGGTYATTNPGTDKWLRFQFTMDPSSTACATYCNKTVNLTLTWTLTTT